MNRRLRQLDTAIVGERPDTAGWREVARDPNAGAALAYRARTMRAAWREPIPDRAEFIIERCQGRRVLDIGCVAHDIERMSSPDWLHRRIAQVADSCVGVDILGDGVRHMISLGFDAIEHDLATGPGPLLEFARFDVIVAGELIEHVSDLDMLFRAARELLAPGGELILTTPNPYAPHRVRAGQRGDCWENTDHIVYAFPSGIAELADRNGQILVEAATTVPDRRAPRGPAGVARALKRRLKGSGWVLAGISTQGPPAAVKIRGWPHHGVLWGERPARFVGETFVYVLRNRRETAGG